MIPEPRSTLTVHVYEQREKQLKKQGKSRLIIKRLAEKTLNRAKLRQHHQQHVSGLTRAFMSDANLGPSDKIELLGKVDQLKESVGARLDQLEQLSKELLQIVSPRLSA